MSYRKTPSERQPSSLNSPVSHNALRNSQAPRERYTDQVLRQIDDANKANATRSRELDDREQDLNERLEELAYRTSHVDDREARLNTQRQSQQERASELRRQARQVELLEEALRQREADLQRREDVIQEREAEIERREEVIQEWESELDAEDDDSMDELYEDVDRLTIHNSAEDRPETPVAPPLERQSQDHRLYVVNSPTVQGVVQTWATAGHATLPHHGAIAVRVTPRTGPEHSHPFEYFTILRGTRPGVYEARWEQVKPYVHRISGAIFKGHNDRATALLDYYVACDLRIIRQLRQNPSTRYPANPPRSIVSINPPQHIIADAIAHTELPSDTPWYAVFKGIRTGVFPFWSIAASLTHRLPKSTMQKFSSKQVAINAYIIARTRGEVQELEMGVPYYYGGRD
ncbi:hypothetical protein HWV62_20598 [Athelia sp. TMB]|nr:hypothetical protein HWV62_20598 [Athelia sp. TMB]